MPKFMCTDGDCGDIHEAATHREAAQAWGTSTVQAEAGQWNGGDVHIERLDENGDETGDKKSFHIGIDWEPVVTVTERP